MHQTLLFILASCIPVLVQQNVNGSTLLFRSWAEYKVGFNDTRGNYWIGNDLLHQLTTNGRYKLRFDLQARDNGSWYYAEYSSFTVSSEASNYTLFRCLGTRVTREMLYRFMAECRSALLIVTTTRGGVVQVSTITAHCSVAVDSGTEAAVCVTSTLAVSSSNGKLSSCCKRHACG